MNAHNQLVTDVRRVRVTESAIEASALEAVVGDPGAGAVVSFSGNVRNHDNDRQVESLQYEAHPTAEAVLVEVAQEIAARFDVVAIAIEHRVGPIPIGEAALVVAVSAAHRGEAFAACAAAVDLTKERLPVWKHQRFSDGTDEWVNFA
jgi:molybdopterin synthase catalytic subunit